MVSKGKRVLIRGLKDDSDRITVQTVPSGVIEKPETMKIIIKKEHIMDLFEHFIRRKWIRKRKVVGDSPDLYGRPSKVIIDALIESYERGLWPKGDRNGK
jgi:hypothetical protein